MTELPQTIGIDAGGTRCRVACMIDGRKVQIEAGSANVTTDMEGAIREICEGLDQLAEEIGATHTALRPVPTYIGMAGCRSAEKGAEVAARLPQTHVRCEDDNRAAVRGGLGDADGVLAHCGTGSFMALQREGQMYFAGGWGALLGDEASAQWIGRKALAMMLQAEDGTIPHTDLTRDLRARFPSTYAVMTFAINAAPVDFGKYAPPVTAAFEAGDRVAVALMTLAAGYVSETLTTLGWQAGMPLLLTGGIAAAYAPLLPDAMQAALAEPKAPPIDGALALAQQYRQELGI